MRKMACILFCAGRGFHALILQNVLTTVPQPLAIQGQSGTRRCPFCDVAHGRPNAPDPKSQLN